MDQIPIPAGLQSHILLVQAVRQRQVVIGHRGRCPIPRFLVSQGFVAVFLPIISRAISTFHHFADFAQNMADTRCNASRLLSSFTRTRCTPFSETAPAFRLVAFPFDSGNQWQAEGVLDAFHLPKSEARRMIILVNERIEIHPEICHGKPVIRGTRVLVSVILGALAAGDSQAMILEDYPGLTNTDIAAALEFASQVTGYQELAYHAEA